MTVLDLIKHFIYKTKLALIISSKPTIKI